MGIKANFSSQEVARGLNAKRKVASVKLQNALGKASKELYLVVRELAPYKSGTLQRSVRRKQNQDGSWTVYINESQKVPNKERYVSDYLAKIESGEFERIGSRSRQKEALIDRRKMAGLGVQRSPQGTYVGGIFFGRAEDAVIPKWDKRFRAIFKEAMERGPRTYTRDAKGRFA